MRAIVLALVSGLAFAVGCSSSADSTTTTTTDSDVASDSQGVDVASDAGGDEVAAEAGHMMLAPTVTMVMKMDGALHVMWKNNQTDCDSVEVERKSDTDAYKVVFTVPGTVDNKMDAAATANMTYTYRLRCKMGADYSPYSNEKSQNPVK